MLTNNRTINPFPTLFPFKGNRVCDASGIAL